MAKAATNAKPIEASDDIGMITTMNVGTIGCDLSAIKKNEKELCQIYGIVTGIKVGINPRDQNPYTALIGQFEAINLETGETFRSGKLFLPAGLHETLTSIYEKLGDDDDVPTTEFGFTISGFPAANLTGYSYKAAPFAKPSATDPLMLMREKAKSAPRLKALPAPAKE
jgi:hypothetical protein